eukprot:4665890-Amphidinium_carterae.1
MCPRSSGSALDTDIAHRESIVSAHFVPNSTKRGINRSFGAIIPLVGALLQVSKGLGAQADFQAGKVGSFQSDFRREDV